MKKSVITRSSLHAGAITLREKSASPGESNEIFVSVSSEKCTFTHHTKVWLYIHEFHKSPNHSPDAKLRTKDFKDDVEGDVLKSDLERSSHHGTAEINPTRNHDVVGSIPGLTPWVKDLALL